MEKSRGFRPIDLAVNTAQVLFELSDDPDSSTESVVVTLTAGGHTHSSTESSFATFVVTKSGMLVGEANGTLKRNVSENGLEFRAISTRNYNRAKHPRVMGRMIGDLLVQGWIGKWYSSNLLTQAGHKLYSKYLSADSRLVVASQSTDTSYRYLVTAKTS